MLTASIVKVPTLNAQQKTLKDKGAATSEFEDEVAKALLDLEVRPLRDERNGT